MKFTIRDIDDFPEGWNHAAWDEMACLLGQGKAVVLPLNGRSSQSVRSYAARMLAERGVAITTRSTSDELWVRAKDGSASQADEDEGRSTT